MRSQIPLFTRAGFFILHIDCEIFKPPLSLPCMKNTLFLLLTLLVFSVYGQQRVTTLSNDAEISLITIGPGELLNDSFGHNAVRILDSKRKLDIVFNYGRFDFDTPNFYLKFARGKLLYEVGIDTYRNFEYGYKLQQRWIKSQTLNLTQDQKQDVFNFLTTNAKEENKYYKYDFFYDNCSTRPFEIIKDKTKVIMNYDHQEPGLSHRDLIHQYISWNTWGSLGIDVALGSVIDRPATAEEYLFLPHELMYAFEKAQFKTPEGIQPLAQQTETIFKPEVEHSYKSIFFLSPFFILGVLAIVILHKTYKDVTSNKPLGWLDSSLLLVTGILGILVAFLWFGTDHSATIWNYNLLWAFPFHILAAFAVTKTQPARWVYPYMKLAVIMMSLLFFHWIVGVQRYAIALLPLLIAITARYVFILKKIKATRIE